MPDPEPDSVDITNRGLEWFESLEPMERDVFVLNDVDLYSEMEGSFEEYLSGRGAGETVALRLNNVERKSLQQSASLVRKAIGPLQQVRGFA